MSQGNQQHRVANGQKLVRHASITLLLQRCFKKVIKILFHSINLTKKQQKLFMISIQNKSFFK